MRKSFQALLIEQEQDHTYLIKSIANIHDPEIMDRIALSLAQFQVISVEKDYFKPIRQANEEFPYHPNSPTYAVKVVLGLEPNSTIVLGNVCLFTNISDKNIAIDKDGEEPGDKEALDLSSEEAQNTVGDRRIGQFMKELDKVRKIQKDNTTERPVYEKFAISFKAVEAAIGRAVRRGFYIVENVDSDKGRAVITGPFKKAPANYEYEKQLAEGVKLLNERVEHDMNVFEVGLDMNFPSETPRLIIPAESRKWEVEVHNTDSGKIYNIVVTAGSKVAARNKGINFVSKKYGLSPASLIATKPEISHTV